MSGENRLAPEDRPAHDWYRFVLSFPPHLVRDCLGRADVGERDRVLDPFCGTGTTLVECKKMGIPSVGVESHPMGCLASRVKTDWTADPDELIAVADRAKDDDLSDRRTLPPDAEKLLLRGSISPLPLHKTLVLLECLDGAPHRDHVRVALAKALVGPIGNLHFGPEVGVTSPKDDAPVLESWREEVCRMASDLRVLEGSVDAKVIRGDARDVPKELEPGSIAAVITSPPYPNEKDYTRTTRLESVILGLLRDRKDLRGLKEGLLRSNSRGIYSGDDDDLHIRDHPGIQRLARSIEARRVAMGKTSGFERQYHKVTRLYFGGMARHLEGLRRVLRPGARLFYVVGDQASFFRILIRTGEILGEIAEGLGYEVMGRDLFRERRATASGESLREEILLLRWPG
jgi:DNA modification methylase